MQEAIKISSSSSRSSSNQPYFIDLNETPDLFSGTDGTFVKCERESNYRDFVEAELKNMNENLNRLERDQAFPCQILDVPDVDITRNLDCFEKPYALLPPSSEEVSRVYFRGLVSDELIMNVKMSFAGIGVAICDSSDCCLFESRKSFLVSGTDGEDDAVELKALIEALNSAVTLGLKRVLIFCNSNSVYQYVSLHVYFTKSLSHF